MALKYERVEYARSALCNVAGRLQSIRVPQFIKENASGVINKAGTAAAFGARTPRDFLGVFLPLHFLFSKTELVADKFIKEEPIKQKAKGGIRLLSRLVEAFQVGGFLNVAGEGLEVVSGSARFASRLEPLGKVVSRQGITVVAGVASVLNYPAVAAILMTLARVIPEDKPDAESNSTS